MPKSMYAKVFELKQGQRSATVYLHKVPDKTTGYWTSSNLAFDFPPETGEHNQFSWNPLLKLLFACSSIGLTFGSEVLDFTNVNDESKHFVLHQIDLTHLNTGQTGPGFCKSVHSHSLSTGGLEWEYVGTQLIPGWSTPE